MAAIEYKEYVMNAGYLLPPSLADFLGSEDEVHAFAEVTEGLDISCLDSGFSGMGQHPYHPRMLLRLLMWGMANGVVSTRKIEVLAHRDVSFVYLAGGQRPDYRTLARFRRRNVKAIKGLFKETVMLCARLGMVNLGHVCLDGTKLKANSSRHKAMSYGRMKEEERRLEGEIEELMRQAEAVDSEEDRVFGKDNQGYHLPDELKRREDRLKKIRGLRQELEEEKREEQGLGEGEVPLIEEKEQRSFADREARMMLMKRGEFDYGYNGQLCTDEGEGVIVAADLSNQGSDMGHLPGMVEEVRELKQELGLTGEDERETQMSADSGYLSAENIQAEGKGIELLIASGRERKEEDRESKDGRVYSLKRFCYDKEGEGWRCPGGRLLRLEGEVGDGKRRYVCDDCAGCRLRAHCLKAGEDRRVLVVEEGQIILGEMRARMKRPEKQAVYRKRKWVAEQPIGQIKEGMGFRGVSVRGQIYACGQWVFACAVHNVMKAVRFVIKSRRSGVREVALAVA